MFKKAVDDLNAALVIKPSYHKAKLRLMMAEAVLKQNSRAYAEASELGKGLDDASMPDLTEEQLKKFNGTDGMPIYIAVRDVVYDMSDNGGWDFYSPGKSYSGALVAS